MNARRWRGRAFIGTSLDGYIARPDGDIGWLTDPPGRGRTHQPGDSTRRAREWETFYPDIDHLVMGRGTYDKVLSFGEWPFADRCVLVLSTTLADEDPRVTVASTIDEVTRHLDHSAATEVYLDGGQVIQSFLRAGLLDEITVGVAPVLIGRGLPLFGAVDEDIHLELQASHASDSGMVHATYRVVPDIPEPLSRFGPRADPTSG